jgi:hypothetical protein
VITAYVEGREAGNYHFTSGLPVTVLKYLAPAIVARFENKPIDPPATVSGQTIPANVRAQTLSSSLPSGPAPKFATP